MLDSCGLRTKFSLDWPVFGIPLEGRNGSAHVVGRNYQRAEATHPLGFKADIDDRDEAGDGPKMPLTGPASLESVLTQIRQPSGCRSARKVSARSGLQLCPEGSKL